MPSSVSWQGIFAQQVDDHWDEVGPVIQRGLSADYSVEDIYQAAKDRKMQLWVVREWGNLIAVVVTEIVDYPQKKIAVIIVCAGKEMGMWMHLLEGVLEEWARQKRCDEIRLYGREGWGRVLKSHGWKRVYTVLGKTL